MDRLQRLWRRGVDLRPGERLRTLYLFLYLLLVLLAYYILKPVSRSLFLTKFDAEHLPYLYILMAVAGGFLAYFYSKLAVRFSLVAAVHGSTALIVASLVIIWAFLSPERPWIYYLFNVWVSLFSLVLVSQGWIIAGRVFQPWEAKRTYGILAAGSVLGAALGGSFTAMAVRWWGTNNLLLASAGFVILAYFCFRLLLGLKEVSLENVPGADVEESEFTLRDVARATLRYRHLQVIVGILTLTYLVDTFVDFQFNSMARAAHQGDNLTAFLGNFFGLYLNIATFVLQVFLTSFVVNRWGVGGTLMVMPVGIGIGSIVMLFSPGVLAASITRLVEASTRYSFNRTGMELLYLPLPSALKNRTKAFVDVFVDRMARGLGALFLLPLAALTSGIQPVTILVLVACVLWGILAIHARREYIDTVRKRLDARRLELENTRLSVQDPSVIQLLEGSVLAGNSRQAVYALNTLSELPDYPLERFLKKVLESDDPARRARAWELAAAKQLQGHEMAAQSELDRNESPDAAAGAAAYLIRVSSEPESMLSRICLLQRPELAERAIAAIESSGFGFTHPLPASLLEDASQHRDPERRRVAALTARFAGRTRASTILRILLEDPVSTVRDAAMRSCGLLRLEEHVPKLLGLLVDPGLRSPAADALAAYGSSVLPQLRETVLDVGRASSARRMALRIIERIGTQQALDLLLDLLSYADSNVRWIVLRGLQRMRERHPQLDYRAITVHGQIQAEIKTYYTLRDRLAVLQERPDPPYSLQLLSRTLDDRAHKTIDRLFRLLGLRYPPKEIDAARRAVRRGKSEDLSNALEFLDTVLDRSLKQSLIPLLDSTDVAAPGNSPRSAEARSDLPTILRDFIHSGDGWLTVCSMTVAGDLRYREMAAEIADVGDHSGPQVSRVAQAVLASLR